MNAGRAPGRIQPIALLKIEAEFFEARSAAADNRLAFEQANTKAAIRQQGSHGQPANAAAHNNNFTFHRQRIT